MSRAGAPLHSNNKQSLNHFDCYLLLFDSPNSPATRGNRRNFAIAKVKGFESLEKLRST
jgi:hypothetical protein